MYLSLAIVLILLAILAAINKTPFVGIILTFVVPIIFFLFLYRNLGSGENSRVKKLLLDGGKLDIRFSMPYLSKAFLPRDIHEVYLVPKKSLVPEAVKICEKHSLFPFYLYYMSGGAYGGPSKTRYLLFLPEKHKEELLAFRK